MFLFESRFYSSPVVGTRAPWEINSAETVACGASEVPASPDNRPLHTYQSRAYLWLVNFTRYRPRFYDDDG